MRLGTPRHSRNINRRKPARPAQPKLEGLESRMLLYAVTGAHFALPARITYSLVPDGTSIGGTPSVLFQGMNAKFSTATWEAQIEKAAAVWEAVANVNLAIVPDNGAAVGSAGNQQGDPNFGDIRIGGMAQSSGQLAFTYSPPPYNGGTLAGDMFFNTNQSWQVNGSTYDLETVAIHEFGHALGMGHSAIAAACMYAGYTTTRQSLNADDVSGVQSIYGPAPADQFDAVASNNTSATASVITSYINGQNQLAIPSLRIGANTDVDWYYVVAPAGAATTMNVTVQSSSLSSLSPGVWVYNSALLYQNKAMAPQSYGATATAAITNVAPGNGYYIKVVGADYGGSGQGTYGLLVNFSNNPQSPIAPPNTIVAAQPDQGGGGWSDSSGGHKNGNGNGNDNSQGDEDGQGANFDLPMIIDAGTLHGYGDAMLASDAPALAPPGVAKPVAVKYAAAASLPMNPGEQAMLFVPVVHDASAASSALFATLAGLPRESHSARLDALDHVLAEM